MKALQKLEVEGFVVTRRDVELMRYMALLNAFGLEMVSFGRRTSVAGEIQDILRSNGKSAPKNNDKLHRAYCQFLEEEGVFVAYRRFRKKFCF